MNDNVTRKVFFHCSKCKKRLIERLPNGLWRFMFGKKPEKDGRPPVDIFIHGSIKIRCIKRSCGHWNIFNFTPFSNPQSDFPECNNSPSINENENEKEE